MSVLSSFIDDQIQGGVAVGPTTTKNTDVKIQPDNTLAPAARPVVHGPVRIGKFVIAGAALAGMVAVTMFSGGEFERRAQPLIGIPENQINALPGGGDGSLSEPAGPDAAPAPAQPNRIAGESSVNTSVEVAKRAFPGGATRVYLARLDNPVDALPASALTDGPVVLVPTSGHVPPAVFDGIKALHPTELVALGGEGAVSSQVLNEVSTYTGVANTTRIAGKSRVETAAKIAEFGFSGGTDTVYLADAIGPNSKGSPDAVAGGVLTGGPILTTTKNPGDQARVAQTVAALGAKKVVALGGKGPLPDAVVSASAPGLAISRIAGADRYATSQAIGQHAFGNSAKQVYLASGSSLEFALMAGALTDGPILLMPPAPTAQVRGLVTTFGNPLVTAIGGPESVTDEVMQVASGHRTYTNPDANPAPQPAQNQSASLAGTTMEFTRYSKPPSPADGAKEAAVFEEINAERARRGLQTLTRDPVMDDAARAWAQKVATTGVFEHSHGDLKYANLFPKGWKLAGENMVGYYFVEPGPYAKGSRELWVNSPGHLANLANPIFNRTGIGVATGSDWVYCVQNFGSY